MTHINLRLCYLHLAFMMSCPTRYFNNKNRHFDHIISISISMLFKCCNFRSRTTLASTDLPEKIVQKMLMTQPTKCYTKILDVKYQSMQ